MLFILILIGSSPFVSIAILHIRKGAFERQLEVLAERKRRRLGRRALTFHLSKRSGKVTGEEEAIVAGVVRGQAIQDPDPEAEYEPTFAARQRTRSLVDEGKPHGYPNGALNTGSQATDTGRIRFEDTPKPPRAPTGMSQQPTPLKRVGSSTLRQLHRTKSFLPAMTGVGSHSVYNHPRHAVPVFVEESEEEDTPTRPRSGSLARFDKYYDQLNGFVGRNSRFSQLTEKERRILGGIEYDAICFLSWLVPVYWFLFQFLGAMGMGAYFTTNKADTARENGENERLVTKCMLTFTRNQSVLDRRILRHQRFQQFRNGSTRRQCSSPSKKLLLSGDPEHTDIGWKHVLPSIHSSQRVDHQMLFASVLGS
jgi:hypothetical protein